MLERTQALVGHVDRALPRVPEAQTLVRLVAQLRSLRRLVVRSRVRRATDDRMLGTGSAPRAAGPAQPTAALESEPMPLVGNLASGRTGADPLRSRGPTVSLVQSTDVPMLTTSPAGGAGTTLAAPARNVGARPVNRGAPRVMGRAPVGNAAASVGNAGPPGGSAGAAGGNAGPPGSAGTAVGNAAVAMGNAGPPGGSAGAAGGNAAVAVGNAGGPVGNAAVAVRDALPPGGSTRAPVGYADEPGGANAPGASADSTHPIWVDPLRPTVRESRTDLSVPRVRRSAVGMTPALIPTLTPRALRGPNTPRRPAGVQHTIDIPGPRSTDVTGQRVQHGNPFAPPRLSANNPLREWPAPPPPDQGLRAPALSGLAEVQRLSQLAEEMETILRDDARRHGIIV